MATPNAPAACAGEVATMVVSLCTETDAAWVPPKVTAVGKRNPLPWMVTDVPPASGPWVGEIDVTIGVGATHANAGDVGFVPPSVVTWTEPVPTVWIGATASMRVSFTTVNDVAATPPKVTEVAFVKPDPVSVTGPPAV